MAEGGQISSRVYPARPPPFHYSCATVQRMNGSTRSLARSHSDEAQLGVHGASGIDPQLHRQPGVGGALESNALLVCEGEKTRHRG